MAASFLMGQGHDAVNVCLPETLELFGYFLAHVAGTIAGRDYGNIIACAYTAVRTAVPHEGPGKVRRELRRLRPDYGIFMVLQVVGQLNIVRVYPFARLNGALGF